MDKIDIGKLRGMKHAELKEVAKSMNIRVNVKSEILLNAILENIKLHSTPSPMKNRRKNAREESVKEIKEENTISVGTDSMDSSAYTSPRQTRKRRNTYEVSPENSFLVAAVNTPTDLSKENSSEESCDKRDNFAAAPLTIKHRLRSNVHFKSASVQTSPAPTLKQAAASKLPLPIPNKSGIPRLVAVKNFVSKVRNTPDFKAIHSKAFKKLESVDESVAKRALKLAELRAGRDNVKSIRTIGTKNKVMKDVTKKPTQNGRVFRPTIFKLADANFDFANSTVTTDATAKCRSMKTPRQPPAVSTATRNTPFKVKLPDNDTAKCAQKRQPFNLQESLNRKLGYVPHYGPMMPLKPIASDISEREVTRVHNREMLKGVRRNKRFELQLKARGMKL